ncbi:MAG TPA: amino acid permease [Candidimonas sp.]|nr:amino acid permease [Candidimonas sp.]
MKNGDGKVGVGAATMLVAGNMMGSGVFLLPSSLAKVGTIALWGWVVTIIGALFLAFVFAKLGRLAPKEGGPYASFLFCFRWGLRKENGAR